MKKGGFTLIELLAAVAIVSVLSALVISMASAARRQAQNTQCVNNLRQWGLALQMYIKDNDSYLPRRGQGVQPVTQLNRPDDWFNSLSPYLELPPYSQLAQTGRIPKPHDRSVFVCPTAEASDSSPNFITYGMNMYISRWDQPERTKITKLLNTSTLAFLADTPGGYASTFPSTMPYSVVARHSGRANVCFLDGHVQTFSGDYLGCGTGMKTQPDIHWKSGMEGDIWSPPQ